MMTATLPRPCVNHRVRAVLLTEAGDLLLFRRIKAGQEPYWVLPGGGVEASDPTLEAALHREIWEELGGGVEIVRPLFTTEHEGEGAYVNGRVRHHYYACYLYGYDVSRRTGTEFSDPAKGQYIPEAFPLEAPLLERLPIKTTAAREGLLANLYVLKQML
jgi:ADP-ribose pyrophosphatase YjhB (NUDIX family)